MLAVTGLREAQLMKYIHQTNTHLAPERQIELTLFNGPRSFVCTGPPQSLYGLNLGLRKLKAPTGLDQSRVPHSQRKIKFSSRFLPITARFHSSYLKPTVDTILKDAKNNHLLFNASDLKIPVYATDSGRRINTTSQLMGFSGALGAKAHLQHLILTFFFFLQEKISATKLILLNRSFNSSVRDLFTGKSPSPRQL